MVIRNRLVADYCRLLQPILHLFWGTAASRVCCKALRPESFVAQKCFHLLWRLCPSPLDLLMQDQRSQRDWRNKVWCVQEHFVFFLQVVTFRHLSFWPQRWRPLSALRLADCLFTSPSVKSCLALGLKTQDPAPGFLPVLGWQENPSWFISSADESWWDKAEMELTLRSKTVAATVHRKNMGKCFYMTHPGFWWGIRNVRQPMQPLRAFQPR